MKAIWNTPTSFGAGNRFARVRACAGDVPGAHPGYLHALSDFYARALPNDAPVVVEHDQDFALHEIDEPFE